MLRLFEKTIAPFFSRVNLTIWVIGSVLAAAAGPFGTYGNNEFPKRFLYWILVFSISTILAGICRRLVHRVVGWDQPVLADMIKVALMVVMFTPLLMVLTNYLVKENVLDPPGFIILAQSVAAITAAILIARRILPGFERTPYGKVAPQKPAPSEPPVTEPRLARRLPAHYQGPILRLAVRDHFVDVITAKATHTIRLRFLDAIDEMDNVEGFCTHRSHWVTKAAVIRAERNAGRIFLRMVNRDLVPVSRKYKPELESAGII